MIEKEPKTSWEAVYDWYHQLVGKEGHLYHQQLIIPNVLRFLNVSEKKGAKIVDFACGQGVLARHLPDHVEYCGIDHSPSLIREAKKMSQNPLHHFKVGDITQNLQLPFQEADIVTLILAIQDLAEPALAISQAAKHLKVGGRLLIVMNHPCFRIPRHSTWEVDESNKKQFRKMDSYLHPQQIPIRTAPSQGSQSPAVHYYHYSLSHYSRWLKESGLMIELLEEWVSEKKSTGPKKKMEDRARSEFPLFLFLAAKKG
jgi:ubiquinone/menaquinone biosynthesis C-methylase UbiE